MKYRWKLKPVGKPDVLARLQQELNHLPEPLARALMLRGIETFDQAKLFFRPARTDLHDPFSMQDLGAAAERIVHARRLGERVLVYGDYDVDGTTSTALMTSFLRSLNMEVDFFVPDRIKDGYGLGRSGIDYAAGIGAGLIVALDCGITAHRSAEYARHLGIDLVICDHHTPDATYPDAHAVLNPKRPDCGYPFKELSGCGVGFKLLQGVLSLLHEPPELAFEYVDLVALSIASDIVPLYGENRILMREGIEALRRQPRPGVRRLADQARIDLTSCTTQQLVFGVGPRINAAGRMGDAGRAVALLLSEDDTAAADLSFQLEQANNRRRVLDQETLTQARRMAEEMLSKRTRHSVVLYSPDWHPGIIGIVASRIVERFYLPAIMLCRSANGLVKGSARSISGINVYEALKNCEDILTSFGGHMYAAGVSLREEKLPEFIERFDEAVRDSMVTPELMLPEIEIDAELDLHTVGSIEHRFWKVLRQFAPHGPHNDMPVFQADSLEVVGDLRPVGKDGEHLKFAVRQRDEQVPQVMEAIGFGMSGYLPALRESQAQGKPVDMLFSLQENTWNGATTLQLRARDVRVQESEKA